MPAEFIGRAPVNEDQVIAALPYLPWDRALEACKLLVEQWLRDISYYRSGPTKQKWEIVAKVPTSPPADPDKICETRWRLTLATATHHYRIHVSPTYLGCSATSRIADPGETHLRGNDLPDGPFSRITWARILTEMLAYELVEIPKVDEPIPVVDLWRFVDEAQGKDKQGWAVEMEKFLARPILSGGNPEGVAPAVVISEDPGHWPAGSCGIDWCKLERIHIASPDVCSKCVNGCQPPRDGCSLCPTEKAFDDPIVDASAHLRA